MSHFTFLAEFAFSINVLESDSRCKNIKKWNVQPARKSFRNKFEHLSQRLKPRNIIEITKNVLIFLVRWVTRARGQSILDRGRKSRLPNMGMSSSTREIGLFSVIQAEPLKDWRFSFIIFGRPISLFSVSGVGLKYSSGVSPSWILFYPSRIELSTNLDYTLAGKN